MSSKHNQHPTKPNYAKRRIAVASAAALFGFITGKLFDYNADARANRDQPTCAIPVHDGDTITGIQAGIKRAGDDVRGENVEVWTSGPDSRERNPEDDAKRYYVNGQMGMQAGDTIFIRHVDPNVCQVVGGEAGRNPED